MAAPRSGECRLPDRVMPRRFLKGMFLDKLRRGGWRLSASPSTTRANVEAAELRRVDRGFRGALRGPQRPEVMAIVSAYVEHLRSEQASDLARLMSHMAPDVRYDRFGVVTQALNADELRLEMAAIIAAGGSPSIR